MKFDEITSEELYIYIYISYALCGFAKVCQSFCEQPEKYEKQHKRKKNLERYRNHLSDLEMRLCWNVNIYLRRSFLSQPRPGLQISKTPLEKGKAKRSDDFRSQKAGDPAGFISSTLAAFSRIHFRFGKTCRRFNETVEICDCVEIPAKRGTNAPAGKLHAAVRIISACRQRARLA